MGVNHDTKISVQDLWKTESFFTPKYSRFMSRNRFQAIQSCLRFDDSKTRDARKESNRLAAISEVTELFRTACVSNFNTSENVTIDERIVPLTGNCRFRVYVKNKPDKYGIKIWVMSCSELFYMKNYDIYLSKIDTREKIRESVLFFNYRVAYLMDTILQSTTFSLLFLLHQNY